MDKVITAKIQSNPNLIQFINRILSYNDIFENEMTRSMFFASLISADCLIDKHSCEETINIANFILTNIDLFILEDDIRKNIIKYCKDATEIAKTELNKYKNKNNGEEYELVDYPYIGIGSKPYSPHKIPSEEQLERIIGG